MAVPLMPKATAVWLIENTSLTFEQVAEFCALHILEVQAIADGEAATGMIGFNPITSGQLTADEIKRCETDPNLSLTLTPPLTADSVLGKKASRYTPVSKRQDRPDAIAWLLKYYPTLPETQICRLLGTTKNMIAAVRGKTHWNSTNIKPRNPVHLGLCTQAELDKLIAHIAQEEATEEIG
ncbi:cell cycle transcriptional regulator TrcR [Candidatus Paracaedibacter symbiosus]|uniref:cell cycle transcriptional regulator TrcR n=1 Tax=Candidatus Paracaedibacter symbiosus TaxID=244582 RepID=UPI0006899165|nr:cell cycle transcriptional regulator TrcR [Candidatus Paracaedibacter symbiosus]